MWPAIRRHAWRLLIAVAVCVNLSSAGASPWVPEGSWIAGNRVAIEVFDCSSMLCGRIVWLRNPALRTSAMCGRTILWNLQRSGPEQWDDGWFFDPENGSTYHVSATIRSDGTIAARIYAGIELFGKTETLRRIKERSLEGWC